MKKRSASAAAIGLLALFGVHAYAQVPNRPEVEVTRVIFNSEEDDFAPAVMRGGEMLMFTSARSGPFGGSGTQRIWVASKTSMGWNSPIPTSEALSHAEQTGCATVTPDGNFMIFAAYEWEDEQTSGKAIGRTDLYSAERVRGEWTNIRNLGPSVNSTDWDSQPALSVDGRTLYFASDREGGKGGVDIYVSQRTANGWSGAVNLGDGINTAAHEMAPSIAPDSKSLFFSTNGRGGMGGFDIFIAKGGNQAGTGWGNPENAGTPINSAFNEYFFVSIPNSKNSYFCSDIGGSQDIYIAYPNPFPPDALVTVSGQVLDTKTKRPIAADITVTDLSSGEVVANYKTDDRTGNYYVVLARGRRYAVTAEAPDYIFYSDEYTVPGNVEGRDVSQNIELNKMAGGTTRLLIFFEYGQTTFANESLPDLKRAADFLKANPNLKVEVAGHTDSVGSQAFNEKLSQERANSVMEFFASNGVDRSRLAAKGYGEAQPVADNGTEEGKARNRRVELRVKE